MPTLRLITFSILLTSHLACAPAVLLDKPADWPQTWSDRKLYHTPNAYIYATNPAAAGEADRIVHSVARDFLHDTGARPTKGLVIVNDRSDKMIPADWKELFKLAARRDIDQKSQQTPDTDDAALERKWQDQLRETQEMGISIDTVIQIMPIPLRSSEMSLFTQPLLTPGHTVDWVLIISTESLLRDCLHKTIDAGLKKEDVGILARAAAAPMLAIIEPAMVRAVAVTRDIAVFAQFASVQPDWTEPQQREKSVAYAQKRIKSALGNLAVETEKAKATTQPRQ
jgi:hypothetical protein